MDNTKMNAYQGTIIFTWNLVNFIHYFIIIDYKSEYGRFPDAIYIIEFLDSQQSMKNYPLQTVQLLNSRLSMKCPTQDSSTQYLKEYFTQNFDLYDLLFDYIKSQDSFYTKPEPLRHPLIFYYGHTAIFFINKLIDVGLIEDRVDVQYESIFAVGVDQFDWDDLDKTQYNWPTVKQARDYRKQVRQIVLEVIEKCDPKITVDSDIWVILTGIQHQKIHFETSSAIIRRLPAEQIKSSDIFLDCPIQSTDFQNIPQNNMKVVPASKFKWGRPSMKEATYYGWDNSFGDKTFNVPQFSVSTMLVSNGEYLEFVRDNGYSRQQLWDKEGLFWIKSIQPTKPIYWIEQKGQYKLRTMNKIIPLPLDWPVEVNNLEATAFCKWKSQKQNRKLRLPSQDQYHALREILPVDHHDWEHSKAGNINLQAWNSPCPVNLYETDGFYDIIGNVWQHTCTPIYPFKDFQIHPAYEDYTTPFFDGRHYLIKGGSFATIGDYSTKYARDYFRRHFHQFAGFRYVESAIIPQCPKVLNNECDEKVEQFLRIHFVQKHSYVHETIGMLKQFCTDPKAKFLNVGCSVGMIVLEMSKYFEKSYGTDFTTRYFQMVSRLMEKGQLNYRDINISLEEINVEKDNIVLYQMNPENPDSNKINGLKVIVIDGLTIKKKTMKRSIKKFLPLMTKKSHILIINSKGNNVVTSEELKQFAKGAVLINSRTTPVREQGEEEVTLNLYSIEAPLPA